MTSPIDAGPDTRMTLRLQVDPELWLDAANASDAFRRATTTTLTRVIDKFASKAVDYGDASDELGIRAQFVDINRKVVKLKRWMWDGKKLAGEQPHEIMMDLIAHLLLGLGMIEDDIAATEAALEIGG